MQRKEIETEIKEIYKKLPDIQVFLRKMGCTKSGSEDIFQEALLIYMRKKLSPNFELTVPAFIYVQSICKLLWYNEMRKNNSSNVTTIVSDIPAVESNWIEQELRLKAVENVLAKLGKKCQEILQLFYAQSWSMQAIAKKIGLRNDRVVKAQKYRCLQRAKAQLTEEDHLFIAQNIN